MNINGINIPERILTAQQENKLVIFAGAGISIAPPSNLPNFDQLASEVEALTLCNREKSEPIDTYLGRVSHEGKNIYEIIGGILSDAKTHYNDYHTSLLKLFPKDQIRIVTTNQDVHFTSAAKDIFDSEIKMYYAPALPLAKGFKGNGFTGIVYLHGNVMDNLENMVFTDSDFGEAYLVEGWASRFLKDLFSNYTILFIGYSYNDPVMKYFARGMQYNDNRFIFTCREDSTDEEWQRLHITPIYYNKDNNHIQLLDSIKKWVKMYSLQYIDQKERLKSILLSKSTKTAENKDYLFYIITKDYGADFFCELTQDYYWFEFLLGEGKIDFIFSEKQLSHTDKSLICWVAENFLTCNNIEKFLLVVTSKGNYLNSYFTTQAIYYLYTAIKEEKKKNEIILIAHHHQLLALMLHQHYIVENTLYLELLLQELEMPKDINTILLLFKYLIKPQIKLEKSFRMIKNNEFANTANLRCMLFSELDRLVIIWEDILKPNIHLIADDIIITVTEYLKHLYLLFERNNEKRFDSLSYMRLSIEKHEQDQYGRDVFFLIDVARDTMDYFISNNTEMADSIINIWSNSNILILERLAIYSMQKAKHITPNKKIDWLIKRKWLHKSGAEKEVFNIIKFTYFELTPRMKNKLIKEILMPDSVEDKELKEYRIYNFLVYLNNSFPDDKKIMTELKKVIKRNPTFKSKEHPEFDSWLSFGDYEGIISPKSKEEFLSEDPVSVVAYLLNYQETNDFKYNRFDLLRELAAAAGDNRNDYKWTDKLIAELEQKNELCSDIFESTLQGLENESISPELLKKLLSIIKLNYSGFDVKCKKQISWFILGQAGNNKKTIKLIGVNTVIAIIKYMYSFHQNQEVNIDIENNPDNLVYPNFSVASNFMTSILKILSIVMEEDKKLNSALADDLFDFIEEVVFDKSEFSINAKSIIAIDYAFINYYRHDLADKMVGLFDLEINKEYARAMWRGFLYRGNYNDGVMKMLFNNFKKLFITISMEDEELIKAFCFKAASIAIYCEIEETEDRTWIMEMIKVVNDDVKAFFADALQRRLFELDTIKTDELWNDWIREYWEKRNKNIPTQLIQEEIKSMMRWVINFDRYFDEAVDLLSQNIVKFSPYILHDLEDEKRDLIKKHPNGVAKYFYHMIKGVIPGELSFDKRSISSFSTKIFNVLTDSEIKDKISNELVRLGFSLTTNG